MQNKAAAILIVVLMLLGAAWVVFGGSLNREPVMQPQGNLETPKDAEVNPFEHSPVSILGIAEKEIVGKDLTLGRVLDDNSVYTRYYITYKSGDLTISGIMNVPKGTGPFPVLFLNHGYIDPVIYTNGRGLKREQDYLARQGYVVIHSDYRNHADSSKDPNADVNFRLGYAEDVIAGIEAMKASTLPYFNKEKIGLLGHSMGGGVSLQIMTAKPDLIDAVMLYAPVSANAIDNYNRWMVSRPETAQKIIETFGSIETNPEFWAQVSPMNYLDRVTAPVAIFHGTADADVPIEWSDRLYEAFQAAGKESYYHVYRGQPHEFTTSWGEVMQKTTDFFNQNLKN